MTGNQLKIIAMVTMTIDHIGMLIFPHNLLLRIIGRLAMPIYAYMIAEGCRYTRDRKNYLLRLFSLGFLCQVAYFVAMGSLYMCILMTFSMSVGLIYLSDRGDWTFWLGLAAAWFLCSVLPDLLPGTDYAVDYGIWGVLLPLFAYHGQKKGHSLQYFSIGLLILCADCGYIQWYSLATVPLLALYNGQRGKWNIGKLFYFYYPTHLVVLEGLCLLIR